MRTNVSSPATPVPDPRAFRALVDSCRPDLQAQCYRMLGSLQDAEDAVQEVLVRAWTRIDRFEGRSSLRSWLHRIAINVCLDALERSARRGTHRGGWIEPYPETLTRLADEEPGPAARFERRESLELAFVAALQQLSPRQRAVLILRDVLGFSAHETAGALGMTSVAANSALQHARRRLDERLPERTQLTTLRELGDARLEAIVTRYCDALQTGDAEAMVALLTEDAVWSMPPTPRRYEGHADILAFLTAEPFTIPWRPVVTRANGQVAIGWYRGDGKRDGFHAEVLEVLTLRGARIFAVTAWIDSSLFPRFDLPVQVG